MKPLVFLTLMVVGIIALAALDQIQLVQDLITKSGYSGAEVLSGIGGIYVVFLTLLAIVDAR